MFRATIICGLLSLAVFLVYWQTLEHGFVNYDDDKYVYANPHVAGGLSGRGVVWAFANHDRPLWIPVTWLSLMWDAQLFGQRAWGYHLTNLVLHAATAICLFLALWRMTDRPWTCALAAALFALHPLRVESVAWVTERKDVLSGLCFALALLTYADYARHRFAIGKYLTVFAFAALGLMAKPTLVTLPFVLLLLDYWPLGRMTPSPADLQGKEDQWPGRWALPLRLVVEKLPLFALVAAAAAATYAIQGKAIAHSEQFPLAWRIGNAAIAYTTYIERFFWPAGLAVSYPRLPLELPMGQLATSAAILFGITAMAVACRRKFPYLLVGWLWYLGMLVPVIGLVQVGTASVTDRFTYLPQIGLAIAVAWAAADVAASSVLLRRVVATASVAAVVCLTVCAWRQASYWRDDETLWTRSLACNPEDAFAEGSLGMTLHQAGRIDEAVRHYERALAIRPDDAVHNNLGGILASRGEMDAALAHFERAVEISPDYAAAHKNIACLMAERGQADAAVAHFEKAIGSDPNDADARARFARLLQQRKEFAKAADQWRAAIAIQPTDLDAVCRLATLLATCPDASVRNGAEALELANWAVRLSGRKDAAALGVLAAAYAEVGEFAQAIDAARSAAAAASARGDQKLADALLTQAKHYEADAASGGKKP